MRTTPNCLSRRFTATVRRTAITTVILFVGALPVSAQEVGGIAVGDRAPRVTVSDLAGKPVTLLASGPRPTLVEFWATWCEYCERLEPRMSAAFARFGHEVQFYAVAVNVNESAARVQRHVGQRKLAYPVVYDASGAATRLYDVPGTSFVVLTDSRGVVTYTGLGDDQDLAAAITKALHHPPQ